MIRASIAILILAHDNENQLRRLIDHLKSDFDIFVHIDKNAKMTLVSEENVKILKKYRVYWGSFNLTLATLDLFREARKGGYKRYIFISGKDLPLVKNSEIINFFEGNLKEYFLFEKLPRAGWSYEANGGFDRLRYFYANTYISPMNIFEKHYQNLVRFFFKITRKLQDRFKLYRKIKLPFFGGEAWLNLTDECLDYAFYFIKTNKWYLRIFRYSMCPDEIFFQTIICNSKFLESSINDPLRYIDWSEGGDHPKTYRIEDLDKILASNQLFGRKFDENVDNEIIDKIYELIS